MYLNDHEDHFADRRDLKSSLPGGYHPWTSWPASDPRGGWAAIVLKEEGLSAASGRVRRRSTRRRAMSSKRANCFK
jgi:hypothetical protein